MSIFFTAYCTVLISGTLAAWSFLFLVTSILDELGVAKFKKKPEKRKNRRS